jgi:hypothetical protein
MYLGDDIGSNESLENEYKEFCIKKSLFDYYTTEELNHIVQTGVLPYTFNNLILDNLQLYFDMYIPKYSSAFHNSNVTNGNIEIGINDFSEITGIPYTGNIPYKTISKMIKKSQDIYINDHVTTKVQITKLKCDVNLISDTTDIYIARIHKKNCIHKLIHEKYYKERKIWVSEVLKYSVKLSDIIKNCETREIFYSWIKYQDCNIINECITCISDTIQNIPYKRMYIQDKQHVIYWIAKFKDVHMDILQKRKPEVPNISRLLNSSVYLLTHLTDMRHKFIMNNGNLNYYKIQIKFIPNKNPNLISYRKKNRLHDYISYRKEHENGPYCITTT